MPIVPPFGPGNPTPFPIFVPDPAEGAAVLGGIGTAVAAGGIGAIGGMMGGGGGLPNPMTMLDQGRTIIDDIVRSSPLPTPAAVITAGGSVGQVSFPDPMVPLKLLKQAITGLQQQIDNINGRLKVFATSQLAGGGADSGGFGGGMGIFLLLILFILFIPGLLGGTGLTTTTGGLFGGSGIGLILLLFVMFMFMGGMGGGAGGGFGDMFGFGGGDGMTSIMPILFIFLLILVAGGSSLFGTP